MMLIERQAIWIGEPYEVMADELAGHVRLMKKAPTAYASLSPG
ncbi:hypothetical protein [Sulfuritalea sp.]|nr:hypothetical protein [Sulfuritalea sp.]